MAKLRKKVKANEDKCKQMQTNLLLTGNAAKLEPRLFVIMDTDQLQKQVNRLENRFNRLERKQAKSDWVRGHGRRKRR